MSVVVVALDVVVGDEWYLLLNGSLDGWMDGWRNEWFIVQSTRVTHIDGNICFAKKGRQTLLADANGDRQTFFQTRLPVMPSALVSIHECLQLE